MSLGFCVCTSCEQKPSPEEAVQQLAAMGIDFKHYEKSLFEAIASNNVHVVKMLLAAGASVHALNQEELTPLLDATVQGRKEIVALLLDYGADVNAAHKHGVTSLMVAALCGFPEIVDMLLDEGASVNASAEGMTALHAATIVESRGSYKGVKPTEDLGIRAEVVKLLLQRGANANVTGLKGITPLHCAAEFGNTEAIRLLIKAGANLNALDEDDETPLYKAIRKEHTDAVKLLLNSGANVNAGQKELLTEASRHRNWEIVDLLLEAGAKK